MMLRMIAVLYPLIWLALLMLILESIWRIQTQIQTARREMMTIAQEMRDALSRINAATGNIAADIRRLANQFDPDAITRDEALALKDSLNAAADRLETIAAETPDEPGDGTVQQELPFEGDAQDAAPAKPKRKR